MFACKNTGIEFPSKSIPAFLTVLKFSINFHAAQDNVITAKYNKTRKEPEKRFSVSFHYKKTSMKNLYKRSNIIRSEE